MSDTPDQVDRQIIHELMKDTRRSNRELAKELGKPPSTVYSRIRKLEENYVIKRYTITVNYEKLGINVTAFVFVSLHPSAETKAEDIAEKISYLEGVQEVHMITGSHDLLVKVMGKSMKEIGDLIINKIREMDGVANSMTSTVLRTISEPYDEIPKI